MPLKWKIYYACSWILLLWSILTTCFITYDFFNGHAYYNHSVIKLSLSTVMMSILVSQSVFSMILINHLKNGTEFSTVVEKTSHITNVIAIILSILFGAAVIYKIPTMLKQTYYRQVFANVFSTLAIFSLVYLCALQNKLKAAIAKEYYSSIETIGTGIEA
jgi:hypothetical protein